MISSFMFVFLVFLVFKLVSNRKYHWYWYFTIILIYWNILGHYAEFFVDEFLFWQLFYVNPPAFLFIFICCSIYLVWFSWWFGYKWYKGLPFTYTSDVLKTTSYFFVRRLTQTIATNNFQWYQYQTTRWPSYILRCYDLIIWSSLVYIVFLFFYCFFVPPDTFYNYMSELVCISPHLLIWAPSLICLYQWMFMRTQEDWLWFLSFLQIPYRDFVHYKPMYIYIDRRKYSDHMVHSNKLMMPYYYHVFYCGLPVNEDKIPDDLKQNFVFPASMTTRQSYCFDGLAHLWTTSLLCRYQFWKLSQWDVYLTYSSSIFAKAFLPQFVMNKPYQLLWKHRKMLKLYKMRYGCYPREKTYKPKKYWKHFKLHAKKTITHFMYF